MAAIKRVRGGQPGGPFHVQVVKGRRLSNDLPNRLNDYKYQFPRRQIIAVNVVSPEATDNTVIYEVIWEDVR